MRTYTKETIGYINLFESLTKARVKDCIQNKQLIFIVEQGDIGKAIGKRGINVKKVSATLKKKIKVVEFNENSEKFILNLIAPIDGKVYKENNEVRIEIKDKKDKAILIGRNRQNLKELNNIISKYFDIKINII